MTEILTSPRSNYGLLYHSTHVTESSEFQLYVMFSGNTTRRRGYHASTRLLSRIHTLAYRMSIKVRITSCNNIMALEIRITTSNLNEIPVYPF